MRLQMFSFTIRKYYLLCSIVIIIVIYKMVNIESDIYQETKQTTTPTYSYFPNLVNRNNDIIDSLYTNSKIRTIIMKHKIERLERKYRKSQSILLNSKPMLNPNYNVHIFYYAWYGNIKTDGKYKHWNHQYLVNWRRDDSRIYPTGVHNPPRDIGSNYYPYLDCYSSSDPNIIDTHFKEIRDAGIGVIVLSWSPANFTDSPNDILPKLFQSALKYKLRISIHIEPYKDRNPINLLTYLKQFFGEYGKHPALYKIKKPLGDRLVPVIYIYDSYLIPSIAWKELLSVKSNLSVRNTALDAIYLGLLVDIQHKYHIKKSQFDGFYTYFAINSFTYGSTWKNWRYLAKFALQNGLIFVPSVGPGYIDSRVRPWNTANTRLRRHGQYYDIAWRAALNNNVNYISITSFNEWHEGTQIEPAKAKSFHNFTYLDYEPEGPLYYLNLTKTWIQQFEKSAV